MNFDYIVIGSGVAGLSVALGASQDRQRVLVITKGQLEESNTRWAQGGIAAAVAQGDSPALHTQDTLVAGAGLNNNAAVDALTAGAPQSIQALLDFGVDFDRQPNGELELGREGAHSVNRVLHAGGDATGFHIEKSLAQAVRTTPEIEVWENHFATDLIVQDGRVTGVKLITPSGQTLEVLSRFVVIASGGAGQLYRYTTNPSVTTGDGLALAWRAGAMLADLEFFQFHPTALNLAGAPSFLISEAVRGDGAILRNSAGRAFMKDYDARGELASRDIVSRAIADEMQKTGGPVYLDATGLGPEVVKHRFPTIYTECLKYGLDMANEPIPVSPAAHYFMGGIATGLNGETSLPGLFACGEAACTGVHGANRLASNSLLEGLVFGRRVYNYSQSIDIETYQPDPLTSNSELKSPLLINDGQIDKEHFINIVQNEAEFTTRLLRSRPSKEALQNLMWEKVGLGRDANGLNLAIQQLNEWQEQIEALLADKLQPEQNEYELLNMITIGRLMAYAALTREESRGAHFRRDYPKSLEKWRLHIIFQNNCVREPVLV